MHFFVKETKLKGKATNSLTDSDQTKQTAGVKTLGALRHSQFTKETLIIKMYFIIGPGAVGQFVQKKRITQELYSLCFDWLSLQTGGLNSSFFS